MKINSVRMIEQDGFLDFRQVQRGMWPAIESDFLNNHEIVLPPKNTLRQYGRERDLRILMNPITITITFENTSYIQYRFKRGFLTDLASVPSFVRSIIDNDDSRLVPAALVHDANFDLQPSFAPFRQSNVLLREMARKGGLRARAWFAFWAVNSFVGRIIWKKHQKYNNSWTARTVEISHSWPAGVDYTI